MLYSEKIIGGCAALATALAFCGAADARDFNILYSNPTPQISGLSLDEAGTITVANYAGGKHQVGIAYQLDTAGHATPLYQFQSKNGPSYPTTHLLRDASGDFYGIASRLDGQNHIGTTVYKISNGVETTLHFFGEGEGDLGGPRAGLITDGLGSFYGATCSAGNGMGNVFQIGPDGAVFTLYNFSGTDGNCPMGDLALDAQFNLYGTTFSGGAHDGGTVFRISHDGGLTTLHDFNPATDGSKIWAGVTLDERGNVYGIANNGGPGGNGTVWKIARSGAFSVLHAFQQPSDGEEPYGALVRDARGTLYGVTIQGGSADNKGTLFSLRPKGQFQVLHSFLATEGYPASRLVIDANGNLFGGTIGGGEHNGGVVYEMGK